MLCRPCPPASALSQPLPTHSQPDPPGSLGATKTIPWKMKTCEFPLKLVHKFAHLGWSNDLSQYFSGSALPKRPLAGRDVELVVEIGEDFLTPSNTSIHLRRHLSRAYYVPGTGCSRSQTSNQHSGRGTTFFLNVSSPILGFVLPLFLLYSLSFFS